MHLPGKTALAQAENLGCPSMVQRSTQRFHPSWPTGHRFFPKSPESMDGKAHSLSNRDPLTKRKNRTLRRLPRIIRPKNAPGLRLRLVLCGDWHGTRRLPCCAGFSLADQGSHSHPRGDLAPYRSLFSVSWAHPYLLLPPISAAVKTSAAVTVRLMRACANCGKTFPQEEHETLCGDCR